MRIVTLGGIESLAEKSTICITKQRTGRSCDPRQSRCIIFSRKVFSQHPISEKPLALRNHRPELDFWGCRKSFRNWAPGSGKVSGAWSTDSGRNLTGQVDYLLGTTSGGITSGCFSRTTQRPPVAVAEGQNHHQIVLNFDAATVWGEHAGAEFVPPHVWQPAILYLGLAAQV